MNENINIDQERSAIIKTLTELDQKILKFPEKSEYHLKRGIELTKLYLVWPVFQTLMAEILIKLMVILIINTEKMMRS